MYGFYSKATYLRVYYVSENPVIHSFACRFAEGACTGVGKAVYSF